MFMSLDPLSDSLMWEGGGRMMLTQDSRVEKVNDTSLQITTGDGKGGGRTIVIAMSEADGAARCGE